MVRDLVRNESADILGVLDALQAIAPDAVLLLDIDYDFNQVSADLIRQRLQERGLDFPHIVANRPNSGLRTPYDLNGDGRINDPQDAQGFGDFAGQGGMLLMSRWPLGEVLDQTPTLWRDYDSADPPRRADGSVFPSKQAFDVQRLAYVAQWQVPVLRNGETALTLTVLHAAPPVFDGPEDQNGRRNADQLGFTMATLPSGPGAVMGTLNLDPHDSDGIPTAIRRVLSDRRLQDPEPRAEAGRERALRDMGVNQTHLGDARLDTADWNDDGPGNLRVDYLLPTAQLSVVNTGLYWPETGRRALVWADIEIPD